MDSTANEGIIFGKSDVTDFKQTTLKVFEHGQTILILIAIEEFL